MMVVVWTCLSLKVNSILDHNLLFLDRVRVTAMTRPRYDSSFYLQIPLQPFSPTVDDLAELKGFPTMSLRG